MCSLCLWTSVLARARLKSEAARSPADHQHLHLALRPGAASASGIWVESRLRVLPPPSHRRCVHAERRDPTLLKFHSAICGGSVGVPVGTISAAFLSGWAKYRPACGTQTAPPPLPGDMNVAVLPPAASLPLAPTAAPHVCGWIDRFGRRAEEGDLRGSISAGINEPTRRFHNLLKSFLHP